MFKLMVSFTVFSVSSPFGVQSVSDYKKYCQSDDDDYCCNYYYFYNDSQNGCVLFVLMF